MYTSLIQIQGSTDSADLGLLVSGTLRNVDIALEELADLSTIGWDDMQSTGLSKIPVNCVKWFPGLSCKPVKVYM